MATAASAAMSVTKSAAALPTKKCTDFRRGSSSSRVATIRASASVEKNGGGGGGGGGSNAGGGCSSISSNGGGGEGKKGVPNNSKYVVPLVEKATAGLTRPLAEILRDLNKRVPDKIINQDDNTIPWYHANRMLSFYAPGWCGEIRDVMYADNGSVTVLYRLTLRGSDGESSAMKAMIPAKIVNDTAKAENFRQVEKSFYVSFFDKSIIFFHTVKAHRESTGTVSVNDVRFEDPVAAAEELAFCRACARFGFGLYLYHEDETV